MSNKYKILVVGATGVVGRELLNILSERDFPVDKLIAVASEESTGKSISYGDKVIHISPTSEINRHNFDIAFLCTSDTISKKYAPNLSKKGTLVIDKSSYFRLQDDVPLIVPEVNIKGLNFKSQKIISNPNCCAIPLAVALKPLSDASKIARVIVSTYQSVSGAGKAAMDELYEHTKGKYVFQEQDSKALPYPIAFNLFPHIGELLSDGSTGEEDKIKHELEKILNLNNAVTVTSVRVPVFVGHGMSVNVEFSSSMDAELAKELLQEADGVNVVDPEDAKIAATPLDVSGQDEVYVARIRDDSTRPNAISFWVMSDNLRKGAALNAVQIAEEAINAGI